MNKSTRYCVASRALLNAPYAIRSEISKQAFLFSADSSSEEERDAAGDYILELKAAFGEFSTFYKERESANSSLPSYERTFGA